MFGYYLEERMSECSIAFTRGKSVYGTSSWEKKTIILYQISVFQDLVLNVIELRIRERF